MWGSSSLLSISSTRPITFWKWNIHKIRMRDYNKAVRRIPSANHSPSIQHDFQYGPYPLQMRQMTRLYGIYLSGVPHICLFYISSGTIRVVVAGVSPLCCLCRVSSNAQCLYHNFWVLRVYAVLQFKITCLLRQGKLQSHERRLYWVLFEKFNDRWSCANPLLEIFIQPEPACNNVLDSILSCEYIACVPTWGLSIAVDVG